MHQKFNHSKFTLHGVRNLKKKQFHQIYDIRGKGEMYTYHLLHNFVCVSIIINN